MRFFLKCSFFAAVCLLPLPLIGGGIVLPQAMWGPGGGDVELRGSGGVATGTSSCTYNNSNLPNNGSCVTSYVNSSGSADGNSTAYVDENGAHVFASGSSVGLGYGTVLAAAVVTDTFTNRYVIPVQFSLQFELHLSMLSQGDSLAKYSFVVSESSACSGTQTWGAQVRGNDPFHGPSSSSVDMFLDSTTCVIPSGGTFEWRAYLEGDVIVDSPILDGCTTGCGAPSAYMDASNTVSISKISVADQFGTPIPGFGLDSNNGFDYDQIAQSTATPEPGSLVLMAGASTLLMLAIRKRTTKAVRIRFELCSPASRAPEE